MLTQNQQLKIWVEREGLSTEQAAEALGIDPVIAAFALKGEQQQDVTAQGIIDEFRCEGLNILKQSDNRWHGLLDQQSNAQEWLQSHGAQQISLTRVTLEDLFVALAKEEEAP